MAACQSVVIRSVRQPLQIALDGEFLSVHKGI
jgi:hypothetical protein